MSASGYKRTFRWSCRNVRFTPNSGHSDSGNRQDSKSGLSMSALPPIADVNGRPSTWRVSCSALHVGCNEREARPVAGRKSLQYEEDRERHHLMDRQKRGAWRRHDLDPRAIAACLRHHRDKGVIQSERGGRGSICFCGWRVSGPTTTSPSHSRLQYPE